MRWEAPAAPVYEGDLFHWIRLNMVLAAGGGLVWSAVCSLLHWPHVWAHLGFAVLLVWLALQSIADAFHYYRRERLSHYTVIDPD